MSVGQSGATVRKLGGDRAGEMRLTRFLHNERVCPREMIETASRHTAQRARGRTVLAIQDSTTLRDDGGKASVLLHATIAVDATNGAVLGPVAGSFLHREGGKKAQRKRVAFADKQSKRWLDATRAAEAVLLDAASVTVVADRESDIYEEFACRPPGVELLIRAAQDRSLADGSTLFTCLDAVPELGRMRLLVPSAPGRAARETELVLRARRIELPRPGRPSAEARLLPPEVAVWLIEAREALPPPGLEALHWRLLTTHEVPTEAAARQLIGYYRQRWTIEDLFRTMKTKGFDVEALRTENVHAHENLVAAIFIAAVQVLQLVRERDGAAGRPITDLLEQEHAEPVRAISAALEGKTARQKNPHPTDSLAFAAWICARLGGWTGYYGKPGPAVMLNGLRQLQAMLTGMKLQRHV